MLHISRFTIATRHPSHEGMTEASIYLVVLSQSGEVPTTLCCFSNTLYLKKGWQRCGLVGTPRKSLCIMRRTTHVVILVMVKSSWSPKQTDDDGLGRKAIIKVKPQVEQWNSEKKRGGWKGYTTRSVFRNETRGQSRLVLTTTNSVIPFVLPHQELPLKVPFSEFSLSSTGP